MHTAFEKDGTLPLAAPCRVALYGSGARKTIKGGTGSGDVNVRHFVTIEEGLEKAGFEITSGRWLDAYDALLVSKRAEFIERVKREAKELGMNPVMYGMGKAMPEPEYEFELDAEGELAVYVLARISGEGSDRSVEAGDISLSETEIRDILALNARFEKFVLVLNVGGMVNLEPVKPVKNILLLGQLGTPTGDVLADLLLGRSYPSGKLAMTWAPIEKYASTEGFGDMDDTPYTEGIYVGYRYFDTFKEEPDYPFGFGLSYTDFAITVKDMAADEKKITVTAEVRNTGAFAGKEVAQVYYSAPVGKLGKPYQELAAFAKTKELVVYDGEAEELSGGACTWEEVKNGEKTLDEFFGNYGWVEGLRLERYLADHFMVNGVNHFVPHAFSAKDFLDQDCPPHFYAHGHNPQYKHFGSLMGYMNRVCELISGGSHVAPVAILYHGEAEWTGEDRISII